MSNGNGRAVAEHTGGRRTVREALRYAAELCLAGVGQTHMVSLADKHEMETARLVWGEIYGEYPEVVYYVQPNCRQPGAWVVVLKRWKQTKQSADSRYWQPAES